MRIRVILTARSPQDYSLAGLAGRIDGIDERELDAQRLE
jgi:hypothetical protein